MAASTQMARTGATAHFAANGMLVGRQDCECVAATADWVTVHVCTSTRSSVLQQYKQTLEKFNIVH
jgi:hypothetical protein